MRVIPSLKAALWDAKRDIIVGVYLWSADLLVAVAEVDLNRKPPLYEKYHQEELRLPQPNPDLPYPGGRHGKYIWYANHVHCTYASTPRVGSGHSWRTQHRGGGTPCRSTF